MLESLLTQYGYPLLLAGTFFEGEIILVIGGVVAHMGYLSLGWVITCGFLGTLFGDQLYIYLGRRHGATLLARRPSWQGPADRVYRLMECYPVLLILGFRFLYGLRTVTPFAIGMSQVSCLKFTLLNFIGAGIWALAIGLAGYYFGRSVELVLGEVKHYEIELLAFVASAGVIVWGIVLYRRRKMQDKQAP